VAEVRFGLPSLLDQAPNLETPWVGLYGHLDQGIPFADVDQLRKAAAATSMPTKDVRDRMPTKASTATTGRPSSIRRRPADGWARTLDWFDRYVQTDPDD
jgi:carboxymethylenebutenolidase